MNADAGPCTVRLNCSNPRPMILEFDIDRNYRWFIPSIAYIKWGGGRGARSIWWAAGVRACRVIQNGAWFIKGKSLTGSPLGNPDSVLRN